MRAYFTTVVRTAPVEDGGELVCLDWPSGRVLNSVDIVPTDPLLNDPNPRGNTRGGRGVARVDGKVVVSNYHTLNIFDKDLNKQREITNRLFVNIHEITPAHSRRALWVTSTATDSVHRVNIDSGHIEQSLWPREMEVFQDALDVEPLSIDKNDDNRGNFLEKKYFDDPSHLHLNAVRPYRDRLLGLFYKPGVIADLHQREILVQDYRLQGAHNLVLVDDNIIAVNSTQQGAVLFYDISSPELEKEIRITDYREVRSMVGLRKYWFRAHHMMSRFLPIDPPAAKPSFLRGLTYHDGSLFVGTSPAAIVEIDPQSDRLLNIYQYSQRTRCCVHGLGVF